MIDYYVYTDGACSNNGYNNAKAGIGIYFGENDERNVSRRILGKQTNNTAELTAILEVYPIIKEDLKTKHICIVTDSEYSIKCLTSYGKKCMDNQYLDPKGKPIPNKHLVKTLYELFSPIETIHFIHCKSHTNEEDIHSIGNRNADRLAVESIRDIEQVFVSKNKVYLNVPFKQKDNVKEKGGRWDPNKKKWYIFETNSHYKEIYNLYK